jgi:hypothetical protein
MAIMLFSQYTNCPIFPLTFVAAQLFLSGMANYSLYQYLYYTTYFDKLTVFAASKIGLYPVHRHKLPTYYPY